MPDVGDTPDVDAPDPEDVAHLADLTLLRAAEAPLGGTEPGDADLEDADGVYGAKIVTISIYSLLSSALSVVNKYLLDEFPFPGFVLAVQLTSTAAIIYVGYVSNYLKLSPINTQVVIGFLPLMFGFFFLLASSLLLMANSAFHVFLICKSLTPFFMSVSETLYFGTPCPTLQSFAAMAGMAVGSLVYMTGDVYLTATGVLYALLFICCNVIEGLIAKQTIQKFELSQTTRTFLINALSCPIAITWAIVLETKAIAEIRFISVVILAVSCALGMGMGIATMHMRTMFSATYVSVVGVCNKFLSLVFANVVLTGSPSRRSTLATALVLACGSFYNGSGSEARYEACVNASKSIHKHFTKLTIVCFLLTNIFLIVKLSIDDRFALFTLKSSALNELDTDSKGFVCGTFMRKTIATSMPSVANYTSLLSMDGFYGRLGNRLTSLDSLVRSAEATCCGVKIPDNILDGWHPHIEDTMFVNVNASCGIPICHDKSVESWFRTRVQRGTHSCYVSLLKRYFQINSTHVLGQKCPTKPYNVLHVRSGDIAKGKFNISTETWVSGQVHSGYFPHPTGYYLAAMSDMEKRMTTRTSTITTSSMFYVLCEDLGNPTCDYFRKTAIIAPSKLQVHVGKPLLEDVHMMLCAKQVAVSHGSFKRILDLSPMHQILRDFSYEPVNCTSDDRLFYFIKDESQRLSFKEHAKNWKNTGYQRFLVNAHTPMEKCGV